MGSNDRKTSASSAIIPIVNGPRGVNNPERQGLQSALLGQGDPLNITQEVPDDKDYSPIWDVTPAVWTDAAIRAGERVRLEDHDDVADLFEDGLITSGCMGPRNESLEGLRALPASPTARWSSSSTDLSTRHLERREVGLRGVLRGALRRGSPPSASGSRSQNVASLVVYR